MRTSITLRILSQYLSPKKSSGFPSRRLFEQLIWSWVSSPAMTCFCVMTCSVNFYKRVPGILKFCKICFFWSSTLIENLFISFFIDIWCSLRKSFSHRLQNFSFPDLISCFHCCLQSLARNSSFGNLAFNADLTSMKYFKSAFLTSKLSS